MMHRKIGRWQPVKVLLALVAGIAAAWAMLLASQLWMHHWIIDLHNNPIVTDYLEVWVAGNFAVHHMPAAPYDPQVHHAAQVALVAHSFKGFLGWHYPPAALFIASLLALFPYASSFLLWISATFALYARALWKIARRPEAVLLAFASPLSLTNIFVGQNGFLSGTLIGATLLFLESRPLLSGVFLGLLTYKPQLGILFPLVLLFDRRWTVLLAASVTAIAMSGISLLVFGTEPFRAFLHFLPITERSILFSGTAGWNKLQTIYGAVRWMGASDATAWLSHCAVAIACTAGIIWMWRRPDLSISIKAAALSAGALIVTPYLYMYDLPILGVSFAFLYRERRFDLIEWTALVVINLLIIPFVWLKLPSGALMNILALGIVFRRVTVYDRVTVGELAPQRA